MQEKFARKLCLGRLGLRARGSGEDEDQIKMGLIQPSFIRRGGCSGRAGTDAAGGEGRTIHNFLITDITGVQGWRFHLFVIGSICANAQDGRGYHTG